MINSSIKAVIFDLDGVLVHTDEQHYLAWKQIAEKIGVEFNRAVNNRLRGVSRMESLEIILSNSDKVFSDTEKAALASEKNSVYIDYLAALTENDVSEVVIRTLETLKKTGIKLAIGSSSKNARYILQQTGLTDYFDAISDGNNIKNSKPDPEVFLKAADLLGCSPSECLVVEDALAGVAAAKVGDFLCASIGDASLYDDADYKLDSLSDLIYLFDLN